VPEAALADTRLHAALLVQTHRVKLAVARRQLGFVERLAQVR
jgi:hypothetical protein